MDFGELKEVTLREVWETKRCTFHTLVAENLERLSDAPSRAVWENALHWQDNLAGRPARFPRRRQDAQAVAVALALQGSSVGRRHPGKRAIDRGTDANRQTLGCRDR